MQLAFPQGVCTPLEVLSTAFRRAFKRSLHVGADIGFTSQGFYVVDTGQLAALRKPTDMAVEMCTAKE
jgi:hypothetical protein